MDAGVAVILGAAVGAGIALVGSIATQVLNLIASTRARREEARLRLAAETRLYAFRQSSASLAATVRRYQSARHRVEQFLDVTFDTALQPYQRQREYRSARARLRVAQVHMTAFVPPDMVPQLEDIATRLERLLEEGFMRSSDPGFVNAPTTEAIAAAKAERLEAIDRSRGELDAIARDVFSSWNEMVWQQGTADASQLTSNSKGEKDATEPLPTGKKKTRKRLG